MLKLYVYAPAGGLNKKKVDAWMHAYGTTRLTTKKKTHTDKNIRHTFRRDAKYVRKFGFKILKPQRQALH